MSYTNDSKPSGSFTKDAKPSASFVNDIKPSGSGSFNLLTESGGNLLQEIGDKLVLATGGGIYTNDLI